MVVAGVCLAVGAGAFSGGRPQPVSLYQRTLEVAGEYRCPVCAGETAAVSSAAEAGEIRSLIRGWLKQGEPQAEIRAHLVSDYGSSILEKPPASGVDTLVWVLPVVAAALAIAGLGLGFARWRRASARVSLSPAAGAPGLLSPGTQSPRTQGPGPETPDSVSARAPVQERLFDVGDEAPSDDVQELWDTREPEGTQAPSRSQEPPGTQGPPGSQEPPARPLYRRVAPVLGAVLIVAAGALYLVDRSSSPRLPGATATGGATGINQELQEAAAYVSKDPATALAIYDEVLVTDPNQPVALTAEGWLYAEAGYLAKGEKLLQRAEANDPSYDPPHLYRGLVLLEYQRRPAAAAKELKWYLAHGPTPAMAKTARAALRKAEARL